MKYMGSKTRIAKEILPLMLCERSSHSWVEPFVGGGNVIDKVDGERLGADANPRVIQALVSIRDHLHELPRDKTEFGEADYQKLWQTDDYKHKGFAGFAYSYGGKWRGGWRRDSLRKRDYVNEAYRNAQKQSSRLQGVELVCSKYQDLVIPPRSLIYCDPPYAFTTRYLGSFDHCAFWEWCRNKAREGHIVFISEYEAPEDFSCVWEKAITSSLTKETGSRKGTERLFRLVRDG